MNILKEYVALCNTLTKEKQFNRKIEVNAKLNNLISTYNISLKQMSSGHPAFEYYTLLVNDSKQGIIQIQVNTKHMTIYRDFINEGGEF